jgi:hypothetical protein
MDSGLAAELVIGPDPLTAIRNDETGIAAAHCLRHYPLGAN